jgi:7-carboxy-7-deazaguanine synthase
MRLVLQEDAIYDTIQGEGVLAGTLSTFVRLHGCDFACKCCDTKYSWAPGSTWQEVSVKVISERVKSLAMRHVVVTGGNPLLQADELEALLDLLSGYHVTIETQGSIFSEPCLSRCNLLSLSPKLSSWREDTLMESLLYVAHGNSEAQVKIVVQDEEETEEALERFEEIRSEVSRSVLRWPHRRIHLILQPECSTGLDGVHRTWSTLRSWCKLHQGLVLPFDVRIIPQLHKTAYALP